MDDAFDDFGGSVRPVAIVDYLIESESCSKDLPCEPVNLIDDPCHPHWYDELS